MSARVPDRSSSCAVLIGASQFVHAGVNDLPAVANNVEALATTLTAPSSGILDPARCRVLIDPAFPQDLGTAVADAAEGAADTVVVYYAGHGLLNRRGVLHLAVANTNPEQVDFTAAPMEWLRAALATSAARNRILILDCCFSGRATAGMTSLSSAVTAAIDISGTYTLTSTPANATAIAPPGARFTAFTGELLKVLQEGIPGAGGLLSLRDIYTALVRGLKTQAMPHPQHLGTGLADLIALGRNIADAGKESRDTAEPAAQRNAMTAASHAGSTGNDDALVKEFHQAMVEGYRRAKKEVNYTASVFADMVSRNGGLAAARQLIRASSVSSGFTTLWEKNRLDLTVEATVLQERFAPLFSDEEREIARERLAKYGYQPAK